MTNQEKAKKETTQPSTSPQTPVSFEDYGTQIKINGFSYVSFEENGKRLLIVSTPSGKRLTYTLNDVFDALRSTQEDMSWTLTRDERTGTQRTNAIKSISQKHDAWLRRLIKTYYDEQQDDLAHLEEQKKADRKVQEYGFTNVWKKDKKGPKEQQEVEYNSSSQNEQKEGQQDPRIKPETRTFKQIPKPSSQQEADSLASQRESTSSLKLLELLDKALEQRKQKRIQQAKASHSNLVDSPHYSSKKSKQLSVSRQHKRDLRQKDSQPFATNLRPQWPSDSPLARASFNRREFVSEWETQLTVALRDQCRCWVCQSWDEPRYLNLQIVRLVPNNSNGRFEPQNCVFVCRHCASAWNPHKNFHSLTDTGDIELTRTSLHQQKLYALNRRLEQKTPIRILKDKLWTMIEDLENLRRRLKTLNSREHQVRQDILKTRKSIEA